MTSEPTDNVIDIAPHIEDEHLVRDHGLVKTTAYVTSPAKKKTQKEGAAKRMAEMRARKKAAGLATMELPMSMVEEIKAAGGPEAWRASLQVAAEPKTVEVEKVVEVVKTDMVSLSRAKQEIKDLKARLEQERQMREEIYEMSWIDRVLGRWP